MLFYRYKHTPRCMINLETLEKLILERFKVYCSSNNLQDDTEGFNYKDRIAHLLMSIMAIDFPYFKNTFISGELKIFKMKLAKLNHTEMKRELSATLQYLNCLLQSEECRELKRRDVHQIQLVKNIIQAMLCKSKHTFKKSHSVNCRKLKLTLPFTFLLKLVAKREVEVRNGKVSLSCGNWNKVLEVIFDCLLQIELTLLEKCKELKEAIYEREDDRMRQLLWRFRNFLNGSFQKGRRDLKAIEVDEDSQYFPPCMANLHQILRKAHRLSYDSRYQYTLFLKDIGLSVDENISLWEKEYSKPHEGSNCTHEWSEKQKRYKYQIQHLYGLIGSHGLKTSHSCDKFIGELIGKMDGGCPFQHLTVEKLKEMIPEGIKELPDVEDIFKYKNCGLPQKACATYLKCQRKALRNRRWDFSDDDVHANRIVYVVSPLQYYNMAKNLCSSMLGVGCNWFQCHFVKISIVSRVKF